MVSYPHERVPKVRRGTTEVGGGFSMVMSTTAGSPKTSDASEGVFPGESPTHTKNYMKMSDA